MNIKERGKELELVMAICYNAKEGNYVREILSITVLRDTMSLRLLLHICQVYLMKMRVDNFGGNIYIYMPLIT